MQNEMGNRGARPICIAGDTPQKFFFLQAIIIVLQLGIGGALHDLFVLTSRKKFNVRSFKFQFISCLSAGNYFKKVNILN